MSEKRENDADTGMPGSTTGKQRSIRVYAAAFRDRRGFGGYTTVLRQTTAHTPNHIVRRVCGITTGTENCRRHQLGSGSGGLPSFGFGLGHVLHYRGQTG